MYDDIIDHYRRARTVFALKIMGDDGNPRDLTSMTILAGVESAKATAGNTTCFKRFACTGHGTHGTISGSIPATGVSFTGQATLRAYVSGSPREMLGKPRPVVVRDLSANWLP